MCEETLAFAVRTLYNLRMPTDARTRGQRIQQRRKALGLTVDAVADAIGKHASQVYRYEKGEVDPPVDVMEAIAAALETDPCRLFFSQQCDGEAA